MRPLAPRGCVRVDARGPDGSWAHTYTATRPVERGMPHGPFAVHLADEHGRFRFVVFDLDASRHGPARVRADAGLLQRALDRAGLGWFACASGPGGGRHVWVPINDPAGGAPARLVARLARAASRACPSLDTKPLTNPRTGAVRPPGSPHRAGGHSRLLGTTPLAAAALCEAAPNRAAKLRRLIGELDPAHRGARRAARPRTTELAQGRLAGVVRDLPETVVELLARTPDDASAHLAAILVRLALARWDLARVRTLFAATAGAPGWEHLRTRNHRAARRPRPAGERARLLARQWGRALDYASRAPHPAPRPGGGGRLGELAGLAAAVERAAAQPGWWSSQQASDPKALMFVALQVCRARTPVVEVDCRRLADGTGMTPSTASRALRRLVAGGRLELVRPAQGRRANAYRLTHPATWAATCADAGGTQRPLPPGGEGAPGGLAGVEERLTARLGHAAHEVWAEGRSGGLGRHAEATATALASRPGATVEDLAQATGYSTATTARHLRLLAAHGLAKAHPPGWVAAPGKAFDRVAATLGTSGLRAARMARYTAERAAWAAWCAELEFLRAPRRLRRGRRPAHRYPRTRSGRPDHARARRRSRAAPAQRRP